jgi:hypothetical protein
LYVCSTHYKVRRLQLDCSSLQAVILISMYAMHAPLTVNTLEFIETQERYTITGMNVVTYIECRCTY